MDIYIKNLNKAYETEVFKNFSLHIESNKITSIMGKSGCGKTTLFNILCNLTSFDSGNIEFSDKHTLSAVFQENRLFKNFTGRENLFAITENKENIENALKICEATSFADTKVKDMSGGMARRIAIARAICIDADVYVMDEPFKGIDITTKDTILLSLKQYLLEKTCIIITHDIKEAINISDDIVILDKKPAEIVFTAKNISSSSFSEEELTNIIKTL